MRRLLAAAAAAIALAGCGARLTFIRTNSPPQPMRPRAVAAVEVFSSARPERAFVEVGIIESQRASVFSAAGSDEVFSAMREEAARQGCDAMILLGSNDAVVGSGGGAHGGDSTTTLQGYRATCAVWRDPGSPPAAR